MNVEILAIGIGHDVSRYYNKAIKITDVQELGDVMVEPIKRVYLKIKKKLIKYLVNQHFSRKYLFQHLF